MDGWIASFRRVDRPEAVCLAVEGEIDLSVKDEFADAIAHLLGDAKSPAVLDLTCVTFFNSTGIGAVVDAQRKAQRRDVQLVIEVSPSVRRVLEVTGLTDAFDLRDPNS